MPLDPTEPDEPEYDSEEEKEREEFLLRQALEWQAQNRFENIQHAKRYPL